MARVAFTSIVALSLTLVVNSMQFGTHGPEQTSKTTMDGIHLNPHDSPPGIMRRDQQTMKSPPVLAELDASGGMNVMHVSEDDVSASLKDVAHSMDSAEFQRIADHLNAAVRNLHDIFKKRSLSEVHSSLQTQVQKTSIVKPIVRKNSFASQVLDAQARFVQQEELASDATQSETPTCSCAKTGVVSVPSPLKYAGLVPAENMYHCAPMDDNETGCVADDKCAYVEIPTLKADFPKCVASGDGMDIQLDWTGCGVWKDIMDCQPCLMKSYENCPAPHCKADHCDLGNGKGNHTQCTNNDAGDIYAKRCIRGITWPQEILKCFISGKHPITCLLDHTPESCPAAKAFDCAFEKNETTCASFQDKEGDRYCTWSEYKDCENGESNPPTVTHKCRPNFDALLPVVDKTTSTGQWLHDAFFCAKLGMCKRSTGDPTETVTTTTTTTTTTTPTTTTIRTNATTTTVTTIAAPTPAPTVAPTEAPTLAPTPPPLTVAPTEAPTPAPTPAPPTPAPTPVPQNVTDAITNATEKIAFKGIFASDQTQAQQQADLAARNSTTTNKPPGNSGASSRSIGMCFFLMGLVVTQL